jgi:hypothetical protein
MAHYIHNNEKLTVAQLIEKMALGCSIEDMKLNQVHLHKVPTHYTEGSSNTYFGNGLVRAYFYTEIAFYSYVTDEQRNADFHTHDHIIDSMKHNSPLVFGIPDEAKYSGFTLGFQG